MEFLGWKVILWVRLNQKMKFAWIFKKPLQSSKAIYKITKAIYKSREQGKEEREAAWTGGDAVPGL